MDPVHLRGANFATFEYGELLEGGGPAATFVDGDRIVCCCGIVHCDGPGAWLWSYIDLRTGSNLIRFYRLARELVRQHVGRLRASTEKNFSAGERCLKMLGFARRGPLSDEFPDEPDAWLYERG
jgi:hypothetical protein